MTPVESTAWPLCLVVAGSLFSLPSLWDESSPYCAPKTTPLGVATTDNLTSVNSHTSQTNPAPGSMRKEVGKYYSIPRRGTSSHLQSILLAMFSTYFPPRSCRVGPIAKPGSHQTGSDLTKPNQINPTQQRRLHVSFIILFKALLCRIDSKGGEQMKLYIHAKERKRRAPLVISITTNSAIKPSLPLPTSSTLPLLISLDPTCLVYKFIKSTLRPRPRVCGNTSVSIGIMRAGAKASPGPNKTGKLTGRKSSGHRTSWLSTTGCLKPETSI